MVINHLETKRFTKVVVVCACILVSSVAAWLAAAYQWPVPQRVNIRGWGQFLSGRSTGALWFIGREYVLR